MALIDGLQSYYKLDEVSGNRLDSVGPGAHNLTLNGTMLTTSGNLSDLAVKTDGNASNYLDGGDIHNYADISISCWIKQATVALKYYWHRTNNAWLIFGGISPAGIQWFITFDDNTNYNPALDGAPLNKWNHWVFQYNSTTFNSLAWKNGVIIDNATKTRPIKTTAGATYRIGAPALMSSGFIMGHQGFWNRTITPDEVAQLYNNGNGNAYPFQGSALKFRS